MSGAQRSYRPSVIGKSRENEGGRQSELLSREKACGKDCGEEESRTWEVAKKGRFGDNGYPVSMESLRRPGFSKPVLRQDKQQLKASPSCPFLPPLGRFTDNGTLIRKAWLFPQDKRVLGGTDISLHTQEMPSESAQTNTSSSRGTT